MNARGEGVREVRVDDGGKNGEKQQKEVLLYKYKYYIIILNRIMF